MHDADRFKLLGQYETPLFEYGQVVFCERLGEVEIVGLTNARIPWPTGKRVGIAKPSIILFDSLADAVKRESNIAICHWWGVTPQTVSKWRKALDVPPITLGTSRLFSEYTKEEAVADGLRKGQEKADDPERRRKIADAKRGKPRPKEVVEGMRARRIGQRASDETRAKMSKAHRRRGTVPPKAQGRLWTAEEDEAVRTLSGEDAAARTGRTLQAVRMRRYKLGMPDGRTRDQREGRRNLNQPE